MMQSEKIQCLIQIMRWNGEGIHPDIERMVDADIERRRKASEQGA